MISGLKVFRSSGLCPQVLRPERIKKHPKIQEKLPRPKEGYFQHAKLYSIYEADFEKQCELIALRCYGEAFKVEKLQNADH